MNSAAIAPCSMEKREGKQGKAPKLKHITVWTHHSVNTSWCEHVVVWTCCGVNTLWSIIDHQLFLAAPWLLWRLICALTHAQDQDILAETLVVSSRRLHLVTLNPDLVDIYKHNLRTWRNLIYCAFLIKVSSDVLVPRWRCHLRVNVGVLIIFAKK